MHGLCWRDSVIGQRECNVLCWPDSAIGQRGFIIVVLRFGWLVGLYVRSVGLTDWLI